MSLYQDFVSHQGRQVFKWSHYFPIYERHFSQWRNRSFFFLEIGVYHGGSLEMWRNYFGPQAEIVGIDIDPRCAEYEERDTVVRIGDQSDTKFLQSLIDEFGAPDIVLDDGSHKMAHLNATFDFLYPKLPKNGIYMVEDTHTSYWDEYEGGVERPDTFLNRCKGFTDELNSAHSRGSVEESMISRTTLGISFYDSIVVLERGTPRTTEPVRVGARSR